MLTYFENPSFGGPYVIGPTTSVIQRIKPNNESIQFIINE